MKSRDRKNNIPDYEKLKKRYEKNTKDNWTFWYSIGEFRAETRPHYKNPDLWHCTDVRILNKNNEIVFNMPNFGNSLHFWHTLEKLAGAVRREYDDKGSYHYFDKNGNEIPWSSFTF